MTEAEAKAEAADVTVQDGPDAEGIYLVFFLQLNLSKAVFCNFHKSFLFSTKVKCSTDLENYPIIYRNLIQTKKLPDSPIMVLFHQI